jgi:hypothetical protein
MSPSDIHPHDCPAFEYEHHPDRGTELPRRVASILMRLRSGAIDTLVVASDTRDVHGALFSGFTPPGHQYTSPGTTAGRSTVASADARSKSVVVRVGLPTSYWGRWRSCNAPLWHLSGPSTPGTHCPMLSFLQN